MAHDEYEHQRRQTAALERIVELLEMKITADDPRAQWDEQEAQRRASEGLISTIKVTYDPDYLAAMQDSLNRTFERIEMARRTGSVTPRHCGNRTLTGDHHAVCDCPDERFESPPDNTACTSRSGLITTSKWKFTIPAGDIKSDRGYFPQSINAGARNGEHVIFLGYTDAGAEFFRPDVKGETTVRWYAIYGNNR